LASLRDRRYLDHLAPGASSIFADLAREIAPVNPDVGQLAEVVAATG
jgi:hypothetical protein